jgi:FlaA1/EpsC-like NDP-sugar epimerase
MAKFGIVGQPLFDTTQLRRAILLALIYSVIAGASFYLAYEIRFEFFLPEEQQQGRLRLLPAVICIKLVALVAARQLGSVMTYFSVPDLARLLWAMLASSVVVLVPRLAGWSDYAVPRGVLLTDFMLCFGGLCAGRLAMRMYRERLSGAIRAGDGMHRQVQLLAIIGAGDAGASLAREFINSPSRGFRPVMFFDDDVTKHGKLVHGVEVVGRAEAIAKVKGVELLAKAVIAMPSASAKRIREIVAVMTKQGIKVETLPSMEELASGRVKASRIRPVEVQDLLGREAVDLDSAGIRHAMEAKVVMVTGAGGSIGAELCRQIVALNPKRLLMLEQSEGALFLVEQELNEQGFGGVIVPLVADVLDRPRIEHIFGRYQPQVVFHAAAHKHVFMMERQPAEAIHNNAVGTRQLAEIAGAHGAEGFVLISTDKAINPTNVMGATKRLAELQLLAMAAQQAVDYRPRTANYGRRSTDHGLAAGAPAGQMGGSSDYQIIGASSPNSRSTKFMAVRFGNVLGSSGSVIPIFKRQIANGGPVTVTHPDVTRYFMTIPEAVGLVLQSFVQGKGGEIFVLDMGQPVKIVDLAKQMIELSGYRVGEDIEIVFSGMKPGEKLFEELQHHTEAYAPTVHPRIMQFRSKATFDPETMRELEQQLHSLDSNQLKSALKKLVPEYTPYLD